MCRMHKNILRLNYEAVKSLIKSSEEQDAVWCTSNKHDKPPLDGALRRFSNKPVTALKAGAFEFCALHLTLLMFTDERRGRHVQNSHTVGLYLPLQPEFSGDGDHNHECKIL